MSAPADFAAPADLALHERDVGSPDVQIARLSARIRHVTEHLKLHRKDLHSRRGLLLMVERRKRLLRYLRREAPERHSKVVAACGLRA